MPIPIDFTEEGIKERVLLPVDWYRVHIVSIGQKPSKSGTNTVYPIDGEIVYASDTKDTTHAGVKTPPGWNFNASPKAQGFIAGFFRALGHDPKAGERADLQWAEGKDIDVFIEQEPYEGRMVNKINHKYRPVRD